MSKRLVCLLIMLIAGGAHLALCQILDDSTKMIYGPKTVLTLSESELLSGQVKGFSLDTSLSQFHNSDEFLDLAGNPQKNLGYIGSPQQPLFVAPVTAIGRRLGLTSTDYLFYDPAGLPFYRTYSLYSRIHYVQGSFGRQWIELEAARNLSPWLSASFKFRRLTAQRQINVTANRQKQSQQSAYAFSLYGAPLQGRYQFTIALSNLRQDIFETGGIVPGGGDINGDSLFEFELEQARYTNNGSAVSQEKRRALRINNIVSLAGTGLKAFASLTGFEHSYQFTVRNDASSYYSNYYLSRDTTRNLFQFRDRSATVGVFGQMSFLTYSVAGRLRSIQYATGNQSFDYPTEKTLLAQVAFTLKEKYALRANLQAIAGRDYKATGSLEVGIFSAQLAGFRITPASLYQNQIGNNFIYINQAPNYIQGAQAQARIRYTLGSVLVLIPELELYQIKNYTYLDSSGTSQQAPKQITLIYPKMFASARLGKFVADVHYRFGYTSDKQRVRMPQHYALGTIYGLFRLAGGKYELQPGVEVRYRSSFYGDVYEPGNNQFRLQPGGPSNPVDARQGGLLSQDYVNTTAFFNFRINRTRVFIKVANITQGLIGPKGYFDVPFYPGQRRYFEFGVDWLFFD